MLAQASPSAFPRGGRREGGGREKCFASGLLGIWASDLARTQWRVFRGGGEQNAVGGQDRPGSRRTPSFGNWFSGMCGVRRPTMS